MKDSFQIQQVKVKHERVPKLSEQNTDICCISNANGVSNADNVCKTDVKEPFFKCRYLVIVFGFAIDYFNFCHRISMGVSIVAMVNNTAFSLKEDLDQSDSCENLVQSHSHQGNSSKAYFKEREGELLWSPEIQGYILGCSFLGHFIAVPFAATLVQNFGVKKGLFYSLFISSVLTFITPFAAEWNIYAVIIVQSLRGISQAVTLPGEAVLVANWFPIQERAISYTIINSGSSVGAVLGSYISGVLCQSTYFGGWPSVFFVSGGTGLITALLLLFFFYDNPSVHPKISPAELAYIIGNQENALTEKRPKTPWRSIFTSVPVYALAFAYVGQMWALCHFVSVHPTFLKTILHYSVEEIGFFVALSFLLQIFTAQIAAVLSTLLNKRNYVSVDKARKFWTLMSCIGYSACLLAIYFSGCNRHITCVCSILALAFIGFGFAGCFIVSTDMSPTFAASINAIIVTVGGAVQCTLPVIVGYLTKHSQTLEQWHKIFFISIAVVMSSGMTFALFGSAEIQEWNGFSKDSTETKDEKNCPEKKIDKTC